MDGKCSQCQSENDSYEDGSEIGFVEALYRIADGLLDRPNGFGCGTKISLKDVFYTWGLIIDDYKQFADWSVCWEHQGFIDANYENADPNVVSFGEFESPKEELK